MTLAASVPLKEHFDALRAADERYYSAMRDADQRLFHALREADQKFDHERDRAVETAIAKALASIERATGILAETYKSDKAQSNEWRGAINDIISRMGGMRTLWAALVGVVALAAVLWGFFKK